jgi:hypothetical protein
MDCPLNYIGQAGRTFHTRYKEHVRKLGVMMFIQIFELHIKYRTRKWGSDNFKVVKIEKKRNIKGIREISYIYIDSVFCNIYYIIYNIYIILQRQNQPSLASSHNKRA